MLVGDRRRRTARSARPGAAARPGACGGSARSTPSGSSPRPRLGGHRADAASAAGCRLELATACGRARPAWRRRRPADGSSTSMITISGAASMMARSTAIRSVTADDGQPSQLPSRRRWTAPTARVDVEQLDVAAVVAEERPHRRRAPRTTRARGRRGAGRARAAGCRPARRRRAGRSAREPRRRDQLDDTGRARRRRAR